MMVRLLRTDQAHIDLIVQELLPQAKSFVAEGEQRLAAQEGRVADLVRKGRDGAQSKRLLTIMRQTIELQIGYVKMLEREVKSGLA